MSNDEMYFEMNAMGEEVNHDKYPDLYLHESGWLIAYPIEIFTRPTTVVLEEATKMLKEGAEKSGVKPFCKFLSGNYTFAIGLKTKSPTKEEKEKIYKAFEYLKNIEWLGGMGVQKETLVRIPL